MDRRKRERLAAAGWRSGTAAEFLGMSAADAVCVEIQVALADAVRARGGELGLTHAELARRMRASASRVASCENADDAAPIEVLVRTLLDLGVTRRQLARVIGMGVAARRRSSGSE